MTRRGLTLRVKLAVIPGEPQAREGDLVQDGARSSLPNPARALPRGAFSCASRDLSAGGGEGKRAAPDRGGPTG